MLFRSNSADYARIDILKIRFWDLDPEWMRTDWITSSVAKVIDDKFEANEGWQFSPPEKEKYQDGRAVLVTTAGDTSFTRQDLKGSNIAMEVTFMPQTMPDSATLIWFLGMDTTTGDHFAFEYSPASGVWSIIEGKNKGWNKLLKGNTQPTEANRLGRFMVVMNGDRVSAFDADTFLGSVTMGYSAPGVENWFGIRDNEASFAQTDILKIRYWNLDEPEWMSSNWIMSHPASYSTDVFKSGDGWHFSPLENEKYQDNLAVLYTTNNFETGLTRDELQGTNCAFYVAFISRDMPESASLVWFLRKNTSTGDMYSFEYFPASGFWQILKDENKVSSVLASGETSPTAKDQFGEIMVVVEGNRVSAFFANYFLGYVESSFENAGTWNELVIRSKDNTFAQVDLVKLISWNLDQ